jgi:hypothetical protein
MRKLDSDDPFRDLEPLHNVVAIRHDISPPLPDEAYAAEFGPASAPMQPMKTTPFVWRDPLTIPPRPWVYGRHMIRKQVSVTVAPGGVGKSSLTLVEALCLVTGRKLLDEWVDQAGLRVWVYNLEDTRDELERRVIGAMAFHGVKPEEVEGKLFLDTARERPLCTAVDICGEATIVEPEIVALESALKERQIDVLIVDPFVSSHRVSENSSGAIDLVAKEWARLADRCNCAIELVHHTRKTGGADATTEDGRGSTALMGAARSGRVLNKMKKEDRKKAGVDHDTATYFGIDRDKANLAPAGARQWIRMASVDLGQGDHVGVAQRWQWPDVFDDVTVRHLIDVQKEVHRRHEAGTPPRFSEQTGTDWIGAVIADVCGLDADEDKVKIRTLLKSWMASGSLAKDEWTDPKRMKRPVIKIGEWAFEGDATP